MKAFFFLNGKIGGVFIRQVCKIPDIEIVACISEHPEIISYFLPETPVVKYEYGNNYRFLDCYRFDCIISYNWNYRLPEEICEKYNCYNFHQALLPHHRGPIPLVFSILQNDLESGVTLHRMRKEFDKGEIYAQEKFLLTEAATYISLNLRCLKAALVLLKHFASEYPYISCTKQNEIESSYESFSKLNEYIVTAQTSLEQFKRIVRAYGDIIPLLCVIGDSIVRIVRFSYTFDNLSYTKFALKDACIYIIEEAWESDKYEKLLYQFIKK